MKYIFTEGIGVDQPNSCSLDQESMQARAVILKRILDAKVERETQALYALQALIHKLEHPNSKWYMHRLCYVICVCVGGGKVRPKVPYIIY